MKRIVIFSIVLVNVLVLIIASVSIKYQVNINSSLSRLNDNQIRVYNPSGFKQSEMEQAHQVEGIEDIYFDNRNLFPTFLIEEGNTKFDARGISIEEDNLYQQNLNYIAGGKLTDEYQVIIAKSLADKLVALRGLNDYQSLIGTEFVKGLTIVGVYPDTKDFNEREETLQYRVDKDTIVPIKSSSFINSFMLFNRGAELDSTTAINHYNLMIQSSYEDNDQYGIVVNNYTDQDPSNDDATLTVNYEESMENGAEGLIDPKSEEYGQTFNQYAFINTDEADRDNVVEQLYSMYPDAIILTSDTKYSDIKNTELFYIIFILIAVTLESLILIPIIKNGKQRHNRNVEILK